jgi:hypothetical protein
LGRPLLDRIGPSAAAVFAAATGVLRWPVEAETAWRSRADRRTASRQKHAQCSYSRCRYRQDETQGRLWLEGRSAQTE